MDRVGAGMDIADANTTDAARIRVLFVEDEFFIREWIAQSLSEQGFAVDSVTNAVDALLHITRAPEPAVLGRLLATAVRTTPVVVPA